MSYTCGAKLRINHECSIVGGVRGLVVNIYCYVVAVNRFAELNLNFRERCNLGFVYRVGRSDGNHFLRSAEHGVWQANFVILSFYAITFAAVVDRVLKNYSVLTRLGDRLVENDSKSVR